MQSPTKKRASGDDLDLWPGRGKRLATTPPRMTRSMLKKLNENGGPPVELSPGLDMGVRRRGPRARPPKRAAQDEAVGSRAKAKRTSTTRGRGPRTKPTGPKHKEVQPQEITLAVPHPTDQERRISEVDVAAASRLAQAAIAAGLTEKTSESGSPVVEGLPGLVRFTKKDLRDILSEAVVDVGVRSKMEPHWLARTEFLTWWERPAADMHHIKDEVRRLAARWSNDLQTQNAGGDDIPMSMLESWRADIVIVGDSREETGETEARNGAEKAGDEKNESEDVQGEKEGDEKRRETEEGGRQGAKEQADMEEKDDQALAYNSSEVAEVLAESVTLTERDMSEWKEAFDKEMAAEPNFRSKRAWTARVSESQKDAKILEEQAWKLDVHTSEWVTKSNMQAAERLLDELQMFRVGLRMDREAFWDEFDQEGAELSLAKAERGQSSEEEVQGEAQQGEAQETEVEGEDSQLAGGEAEKDDAQMTEIGEHHGSSTIDAGTLEVEPETNQQLPEVTNEENDSESMIARHEHTAEENTAPETFAYVQRVEPAQSFPARTAYVESNIELPTTRQRRGARTYAGRILSPLREAQEEETATIPTAELEKQDQGEAAEAENKINDRGKTPWLPDKRGSHSPSWKWPGHQQERPDDVPSAVTAAVEEGEQPSHEDGRDTTSRPFGSRSVTIEDVGNEEENRVDQAVTASDVASVLEHIGAIASIKEPHVTEVVSSEVEVSRDQTLTSGITRLEQDTTSLISSSRSASPETITGGGVENRAGSSSTASNISSLPDDTGSPTPGRAESVDGFEREDTVETASAEASVTALPEDASLPQNADSAKLGAQDEGTEEMGGRIEDAVDSTSPTSHIARLLHEAGLPQDTSPPTSDMGSGSVEGTGSEPAETAQRTSTTVLTSPTTAGIRSGSDAGVSEEAKTSVDDQPPATSETVTLPRGSMAGGDLEGPPSASIVQSPIVVPEVRYIRPQWECFAGLEEPAYSANDYSANEIDEDEEEEDEEDELDELDDWGVDDVDP